MRTTSLPYWPYRLHRTLAQVDGGWPEPDLTVRTPLDVRCPKCRAEVKESCQNPCGTTYDNHLERKRVFQRHVDRYGIPA